MNRELRGKIRDDTQIWEPSEQGYYLSLGKNIKSCRECKVRRDLRSKFWEEGRRV